MCQYLTSIGAYIEGAGTKTIIIRGSRVSASEVYVTIIPDRIEAATYVLAGCLAGRGVNVTGCNPRDLKRLITLLYNMDCEFEIGLDNILVSKGLVDKRLTPPLYVVARPYPAFPTDMQPLIMPLLCLTASESFPSILADTVFPCRFGLVDELKKMGANIHIVDCNRITGTKVRARAAVITGMRYGGNRFAVAKDLISHDLRGGAALILAALAAEPGAVSDIYDEGYIMRGYENISEKFSQIGGNVSVKLLK